MNVAALVLSCQLMAGSAAIAALLGCSAAVAIGIAAPPRPLTTAFWLAMLAGCVLPLYLHAAAWEAAAGKFGMLRWTQSAAAVQPLSGLTAAIWIHGISGAAWVALATGFGISRLPRLLVEQACLDAGWLRRWLVILLPAAAPWIAIGGLWVATLAATEMTVVDLYGVRTLADEFYLLYAAQPTAAGVLQTLIPSLPLGLALAVVFRCWVLPRGQHAAASDEAGFQRHVGVVAVLPSDAPGPIRVLAALGALAVVAVMLAIPLAGLVGSAGQSVSLQPLDESSSAVVRSWSASRAAASIAGSATLFAQEYRWTLTIGLLMGLVSTSAALAAVLSAGRRGAALSLVDLIVLIAVMIPGPIVALAVVWLFRRDFAGLDTLYRQTLVPTCLALLPRSGAAAYITLRVAIAKLDPSVSAAASLDSGSAWRRFWVIDRPRLAAALVASFGIAAAVAVADVPATLPVVPPGVSTVGARLFGLLHSGARQQEASLAIGFVLIVMVVAAVLAAACRIAAPRKPRRGAMG